MCKYSAQTWTVVVRGAGTGEVAQFTDGRESESVPRLMGQFDRRERSGRLDRTQHTEMDARGGGGVDKERGCGRRP